MIWLDSINSLVVELLQYRSFVDLAGFKNSPKLEKTVIFFIFRPFFKKISFENLLFAHI